jgi:hypothetical protein
VTEIHPPIADRTTEQLLDIVETKEQWRPDVLALAQKELIKRGVSIKTQETRRTIRTKFKKRIESIKARATYTTTEKILIVLFGPFLILLLEDFTLFHSGEGYKGKNRQGFFYLILGIGLWFLTFYIYFEI